MDIQKMPTMVDYAPLHGIFEFFGKNCNFNEHFPKEEIYQKEKEPDFDLSIPPSISTWPMKNEKRLPLSE